MKADRFSPQGCIFAILSILLGIGLTAGTAFYQRRDYPVCQGGLSAGFPIVFICDDTASSPISSWGKIDLADWARVNARAFLLDFLLYSALLWMAWCIVTGLFHKGLSRDENFRWGVLICIGYIVVFLFAFMSFQSSRLNFEDPIRRTPTPIILSPTPSGSPRSFPVCGTRALPAAASRNYQNSLSYCLVKLPQDMNGTEWP